MPLTFLRESLRDFKTTGAVAPSSPFLARAMAHCLPPARELPGDLRVLEVGPGTGAFTRALAQRMNGRGRLDLYEISPNFVEHLKEKIARQKGFASMRERIRVIRGDVRELPAKPVYDRIVSGLPLNNFTPGEVQGFLEHFRALLKPDGTLAYFEYLAIRELQTPFRRKQERERLRGIRDVVQAFQKRYQVKARVVPLNVPPAVVRYLKFDA
ncbi:MAG: methyltransferase domain-containing protein [Planctomycetota bacterium]|nr:methyltransferase domain-containing protein [Planctomycetota bacterium]